MVASLPALALVVADAGFVGYHFWKWQTRCPLLQEPLILSSSCDGINGEVVNAVPSAW